MYIVSAIEAVLWDFALAMSAMSLTHILKATEVKYKINLLLILVICLVARFVVKRYITLYNCQMIKLLQEIHQNPG